MSYKRILIKVSGEALMGDKQFGHDLATLERICLDIKEVVEQKIEVCLVVGGGNIYRGISAASAGMERTSADYMGMLATVMNALALQNTLEKMDVQSRVLSAIPMTTICEPYIRRRAKRHMEKNRVVIFAAGTGNPFFSTDTAAALRAVEMDCDAIVKGTQVDGVYCSDPKKNKDAKRYDTLSYQDVIKENLQVMDTSAISLARDNGLPIIICSINGQGAFAKALKHQGKFTLIH